MVLSKLMIALKLSLLNSTVFHPELEVVASHPALSRSRFMPNLRDMTRLTIIVVQQST
jgi:hypothetical protein